MFSFTMVDRTEGRQARWFRWTILLSIAFHGVVLSLGSSALVSTTSAVRETVVSIELMEAPPPDPPAKPVVLKTVTAPSGVAAASVAPSAAVPRRSPQASARRWFEKLDDPLAAKPAVGPRARAGQATPSARRASSDPSTRPDDIEAASRLRRRDKGQGLDELERRVRARRSPAVLGGDGIEAGPVVNGVIDTAGDPIPAGVRNMIRDRVAAYLPQLEAAYTSALRLNPGLKGKLVLRIRIDPRGNVSRAEPVEAAIPDKAFASAVVEKVRGWVFHPSAGYAIEVIYPFVFVAPS